jgi:hypothetical protein
MSYDGLRDWLVQIDAMNSPTRRVNDGSMMRPYVILMKKLSSSLVSGRRIRLLLLHRQGG